jgi:hypothetical protein
MFKYIQTEKEQIYIETDKAINKGLDHADVQWREMALGCVLEIAKQRKEFTMNAVRHLVDQSPIKTHDKRAMGGVIKKARSLGWVKSTGQSIVSKVGHGVSLQIWQSLVYSPKGNEEN